MPRVVLHEQAAGIAQGYRSFLFCQVNEPFQCTRVVPHGLACSNTDSRATGKKLLWARVNLLTRNTI
jgi:hypothetical protein